MRTWLSWLPLALVLLSGTKPARADIEWSEVDLKPKVYKELIDCRSCTFPHEHAVKLMTEWAALGHTFVFSVRSGGAYVVDVTDAEGKKKSRTLGDEPGLIPVDAFDTKYALTWRPTTDKGGVWVASAYGLQIKMPGGTGYIVDSNLNGDVGEVGGDGYVAPESRTVGPYFANTWTCDAAFLLKKEEGKWMRAEYPMPRPDNVGHTAAWRLLNWRRQQSGVLALQYKGALEAPMKAHLAYCLMNKYQGDEQQEGKDGYSEEGALAAKQSVLAFGVKGYVGGMKSQLSTLYHRSALLSPALTHTALTYAFGGFAVNVRAYVDGVLASRVVVYPAHGMEDVPREFNETGEVPMPTPEQTTVLHNLGMPVGLYAASLEKVTSLADRPRVEVVALEGRKREPGKMYRRNVRYPGKNPNSDVPPSNFGTVAIVPSEPLDKNTTYRCQIQLVLPEGTKPFGSDEPPFSYEWEFTTGK